MVEPSVNDTSHIYRAWQQTLLAQMGIGGGIGGWAMQDAEVVAVNWAAYVTEPDVKLAPATLSSDTKLPNFTNDPIVEAVSPPILPLTISDAPSIPPNPLPISRASAEIIPNQASPVAAPTTHVSQPSPPTQTVQRFHLQIIAYNTWCLIVDQAVLQQDSRQATLWQNIATGLRSPAQNYTFPLLEDFGSVPPSRVTRMQSRLNALAGFHGFCQSLMPRVPRLGALTSLPPCFEGEPIERLPQLVEILQNAQNKRVLWNRLLEEA